jgi:hypothetical protein
MFHSSTWLRACYAGSECSLHVPLIRWHLPFIRGTPLRSSTTCVIEGTCSQGCW